MHSRSNHDEFSHSYHWLISQLNHSNFTKISQYKKILGTGCGHFPKPLLSRHLKSKLFPLRISGSTTAGHGWEGQTYPWPPGQLRPCSYSTVFSPCTSAIVSCICHHLGLLLPVTNLYINYGVLCALPTVPFGSTGVTPCTLLFPGARESRAWRLCIPDSREWKNRPGNVNPMCNSRLTL